MSTTHLKEITQCGYNPDKLIGKGMFGSVYRISPHLVFKYIEYEPSYKQYGLLLGELDVLFRLNHPHLISAIKILTKETCPIYGVGIIMPLAQLNLDQYLQLKQLSHTEKLSLMYQLLSGLNFLHTNHYLHIDIKLENILIQNNKALISDFGKVLFTFTPIKAPNPYHTYAPLYRAPEIYNQSEPILSIYTDIWAMGIVFYQIYQPKKLMEIFLSSNSDDPMIYIYKTLLKTKTFVPIFLKHMLCVDTERSDTNNLLKLFYKYKSITGSVKPSYPILNPDPILIKLLKQNYKNEPAVLASTCLSLYDRSKNKIKNKEILRYTCIWMGLKLIIHPDIPLIEMINKYKLISNVEEEILKTERKIIDILQSDLINLPTKYEKLKINDVL